MGMVFWDEHTQRERSIRERSFECTKISALTGAVFVFWLSASAFLIYLGLTTIKTKLLFASPDDAMRLVQIRDFLGGQGWFDLTQSRLSPPDGVFMHWSRFIDLPIATLITLTSQFTDAKLAEKIVGYAWPLLLLFGLLWLSVRLTLWLGEGKGLVAGLILPLLFMPTIYEFLPGRLDHHGVQILLTLLLVLLTLQGIRDIRGALAAGFVGAMMLAIGMETLLFVAMAGVVFTAWWIVEGQKAERVLINFGGGLAGGLLFFFLLTVPPSRYMIGTCDALSLAYLIPAAVVGIFCVGLLAISKYLMTKQLRLIGALVAGLCVTGCIVLTFPQCLKGPYSALDPRLVLLWINQIEEAEGIITLLNKEPESLILYYLLPFAGLGVALTAPWRMSGQMRTAWLVYAVFLTASFAIACVQVRGAKFAGTLAIPAGAWLISQTIDFLRHAQNRNLLIRMTAMVGSVLLFTGIFHAAIAQSLAQSRKISGLQQASSDAHNISACLQQSALVPLNELKPGIIAGPSSLGAHLLLHTHHSVLAAPYHRNGQSILDLIDIFNEPEKTSHAILKGRHIGYILTCGIQKLRRSDGKISENSLVRLLKAGTPPEWLIPISLPGDHPIKIYRILPTGPD